MAKAQKRWVYVPPKPPKPKVPDTVKAQVKQKSDELIESVLKPKHIKEPSEDQQFNYLADLFSKWYRHYFYFCSTYNCPGPNAISPSFEDKFARLEYVGGSKFNLSFMRYTGQWVEIERNLSLDQCLKAIQEDPFFMP